MENLHIITHTRSETKAKFVCVCWVDLPCTRNYINQWVLMILTRSGFIWSMSTSPRFNYCRSDRFDNKMLLNKIILTNSWEKVLFSKKLSDHQPTDYWRRFSATKNIFFENL